MKTFVVYNGQGEIMRTGACPDNMLAAQARPGEFVMEGNACDTTHKVQAGKIIMKSPEEIPKPIPIESKDQVVYVTQVQWDRIQERVSQLEASLGTEI